MRGWFRRAQEGGDTGNDVPSIEIFGGVFALLLALLFLINLLTRAVLNERIDKVAEEGLYKINWQENGAGYVVLAFPDALRIVETGEEVPPEQICSASSGFTKYASKVYSEDKSQLIFAILEDSVPVMLLARNCIQSIMPDKRLTIGWIIADNELLKSIKLGDIPEHISEVLGQQ